MCIAFWETGKVSREKGTDTAIMFKGTQEVCAERSLDVMLTGPRQANLVIIAYANSEGSGEPAHPRSLARTFAARSYKQ